MPRLPSNPKSGVRFRSFDIFISINFGFFVRSSFLLLHCFSETTETFFRTEAVMNFLFNSTERHVVRRDTAAPFRSTSWVLFHTEVDGGVQAFLRSSTPCMSGWFYQRKTKFYVKISREIYFRENESFRFNSNLPDDYAGLSSEKVSILNAVWEMSQ